MNKNNLLKTIGPGILFASTAIGVSHLVQSTRAGATYGFALMWAVLLANIFKYPFFEFGSRYANATGPSILDGYQRIGTWMLILYFLITLGSMFFISGAVGFVTAAFMENLFGLQGTFGIENFTSLLLFTVCIAILLFGNYKALDSLIKLIGSVLLISTIVAFVIAVGKGPVEKIPQFVVPEVWNEQGLIFIIALMGWMPTALDLSTWNSLWTIERVKQTGYKPTLEETLFDFNFGYIVSVFLAICFVTLGAYLVYGSGVEMPTASHLFANKVVSLYTETIGSWSYFIIAAAAFCIMFGTSIAVFDGYARSLERSVELLFFENDTTIRGGSSVIYKISLLVVGIGAYIIIAKFTQNLKQLVDLATTISFLISPLIAIVNFRLVSSKYVRQDAVPPKWLKVLSYCGILFLTAFSILYIVQELI